MSKQFNFNLQRIYIVVFTNDRCLFYTSEDRNALTLLAVEFENENKAGNYGINMRKIEDFFKTELGFSIRENWLVIDNEFRSKKHGNVKEQFLVYKVTEEHFDCIERKRPDDVVYSSRVDEITVSKVAERFIKKFYGPSSDRYKNFPLK